MVREARLRRRKLYIPRFRLGGESSLIPLRLLSPPNPLALGFGGDPRFISQRKYGLKGEENKKLPPQKGRQFEKVR